MNDPPKMVHRSTYDGIKRPNYSHDWLDNNGQNDWEYWKTYIQDKNNDIWEATLNIANASSGEKILYDIHPIKIVGQAVKSATSPTKYSISQSEQNASSEIALEERVQGDELLDAQDLIAELEGKAKISKNGYVKLYHRTSEENAKKIKETRKMSAS